MSRFEPYQIAVLISMGAVLACPAQQGRPQLVKLESSGAERRLPDRILGANAIPFYETLMEDPAKVAMMKSMNVAFTRFPGGTDAQFYVPGTGKIEVPTTPNPSYYRKFWAATAPRLNALHPNGIFPAEFKKFNDAIGSQMVIVTNFDNASVQAEADFFKQMKNDGSIPHYVEMGNESYLALIGDPTVLQRFPDEPHTEAIAKQYYDAIRPYFLPGTKVAFQAAPEGFSQASSGMSRIGRRFSAWNNALQPRDWFQAVTVHLYAPIVSLTGQGGYGALPASGQRSGLEEAPPTVDKQHLFGALMGRFDFGVDRILDLIAKRMPGKEIWITEWNPRGGDPSSVSTVDPITPAMQMHVAARAQMAMLRHPQVTVSHFFMLNFDTKNNFTTFVKVNGQYHPLAMTQMLLWFNNAANGGSTYRNYVWGERIHGGIAMPEETYYPVEAALFIKSTGRTMILQNATNTPYAVELNAFGAGEPSRIEMMNPDLESSARTPAEVKSVAVSSTVTLPALSLVRVAWER